MMVLWRAGIAWSLLGSSSLVVGAGPIPVRVASSHVLCLLQTYYPQKYVIMVWAGKSQEVDERVGFLQRGA
jgi:hypothetical protein